MKIFAEFLLLSVVFALFNISFVFGAEYVTFGSYPQSQVTPTEDIKNADYDSDGDGEVNGNKYRRAENENGDYLYFKFEPISWEAITVDGDTVYLSKYILDSLKYDEQEDKYVDGLGGHLKYASATSWEQATIRNRLNSDLYNAAFTSDEKGNISKISGDNVSLLTVSEAESLDKASLKKQCTDYAIYKGAETDGKANGKWFLKDISPVIKSAVCSVDANGSVSKGMTVLVSDEGYGVVPCISLNSTANLSSYTEEISNTEETSSELYVYKPTGETVQISPSQKDNYLNSGWYETISEAREHLNEVINDNFTKLSVYDAYAPFVTEYAADTGKIHIECEDEDLSAQGIIKFLYPLIDDALTGEPSDYLHFSVWFSYSRDFVSQYTDFSDDFCDEIREAVYTCWTYWGGIVNTDISYRYSDAAGFYLINIDLEINADVNDYYNIIKEISNDARAYSQSQLGQIQYIRHYLAENVKYDETMILNNSPKTLLLNGVGVCGCYANAVKDLCIMLDIPCLVVSSKKFSHGWNCLYIEGSWYEIDTTAIWDDGYEVNGEYREFTEGKFSDSEATAGNVSFLNEPILMSRNRSGIDVDSISSSDYAFIKNIFQNGFSASEFKNTFTIPDKENNSITVIVNGKVVYSTKEPHTENGRILVPMRIIFEALGADVSWDSSTKTITASKDNITAKIQIDSNIMYVNGEAVTLDAAAKIEGGETFIPIRAASEAFGADVDWNSAAGIITVKT